MLSYAGNVDDEFTVSRIFLVNRVCSLRCAVCSVQCAVCSVQSAVCSVQCAVCSVQCAVCKCHTPILRTIVRSHLRDPMSCKYRLKCSNGLTWLCSLLHSCYIHVSWEVVYSNSQHHFSSKVCGYDLPGLSSKGVVISGPGLLSLWKAQTLHCGTRSWISRYSFDVFVLRWGVQLKVVKYFIKKHL